MKLPITALMCALSDVAVTAAASSNWQAEPELYFERVPREFRTRTAAPKVPHRPPHHRYRPHRAQAARRKS